MRGKLTSYGLKRAQMVENLSFNRTRWGTVIMQLIKYLLSNWGGFYFPLIKGLQ